MPIARSHNPPAGACPPLCAALIRADRAAGSSERLRRARADAHMLAQFKIVRCRCVQRERPAKMCGPKCGRCAQRASKERRVRERRRATAAPAAACDGGMEWRASGLSREPSSTRGGTRAGMLQGVRVRARVCTCRRPGAPCQIAELNHTRSTRPHEDMKISPCRSRGLLAPRPIQSSMPMRTAELVRERVWPLIWPCTRPHHRSSASAKTTRDALHLRQSGDEGK